MRNGFRVCLIGHTRAEIRRLQKALGEDGFTWWVPRDHLELQHLISEIRYEACGTCDAPHVCEAHDGGGAWVVDPAGDEGGLVRRLEESLPTNPIPTLYIYTAKADPVVLFRLAKAGARACFRKPDDVALLAESLRRLKERSNGIVESVVAAVARPECPASLRLAVSHTLADFAHLSQATDICTIIGLSYPHFCRQFTRHTGCHFWDFVLALKVEAAKELLTDVHLYVKEVADRVGLDDVHHFSRVFKHQTGVAPSEYRQHSLRPDVNH